VIKIASHGPFSGSQAIFGTDMLRGAQLAVQQLAGPLIQQGYQIQLVPYDDKNNLNTALTQTAEVIADPDILCALGHYTSRITIQLAERYHKAGLALVAPATTENVLTDRGYPEINRVIGRSDGQGVAGAHFANAQGFKTVYIITQKEPFALKSAENFRTEAGRLKLRVLGMLITNQLQDPTYPLRRMLAANPDLVYYAGTPEQAIAFFSEARGAGYAGAFLGLDDLNNPPMMDLGSPSLVRNGGLYFTILTAPANLYPRAAQFLRDFDTYYGTSPLLFATRAYDAAGICIKAIEIASRAKGGEIPTRKEVANAIRALKDYRGLTGTYSFNKNGDPTLMKYYVVKVVSVDATKWDQNSIIASFDVARP
jgi:branched-chain amino acid transport system substrate-binding protein